MIILCDIDGVLADCSHRLHYLENKDYDKFYSEEEMLKDKPIPEGIDLVSYLIESPMVELHYLTGRPYRTQETTDKWLSQFSLESPLIMMRHDHDFRKSEIVKAETLDKFLENYEIGDQAIIFIDDDPLNVAGVCQKHPQIKGITFGAERLNRLIDFADRYNELCK